MMTSDAGVSPLLARFVGRWSIARRIADGRGGQQGRFRGTGVFRAQGEVLLYHEDGLLVLGQGVPLRATRDYLWRPDGAGIAVDYGDGRPFHRFDPGDPSAEHLCGRDLYRVRYDFGRWPDWRAEWQVTGPAKDYLMVSDYAPLPQAAGPETADADMTVPEAG